MHCCFQVCQGSQMTAYPCLLRSLAFRSLVPREPHSDVPQVLTWMWSHTCHGPKGTLTDQGLRRMSPMFQTCYSSLSGRMTLQAFVIRASSCCLLRRWHGALLPCHPLTRFPHWLRETNSKIRGSEDVKVLKQHKNSLQAHHKGIVGSEVFSAARHKIFPSSSYRIHDHVVGPTPQVLDADHDLLSPA